MDTFTLIMVFISNALVSMASYAAGRHLGYSEAARVYGLLGDVFFRQYLGRLP